MLARQVTTVAVGTQTAHVEECLAHFIVILLGVLAGDYYCDRIHAVHGFTTARVQGSADHAALCIDQEMRGHAVCSTRLNDVVWNRLLRHGILVRVARRLRTNDSVRTTVYEQSEIQGANLIMVRERGALTRCARHECTINLAMRKDFAVLGRTGVHVLPREADG